MSPVTIFFVCLFLLVWTPALGKCAGPQRRAAAHCARVSLVISSTPLSRLACFAAARRARDRAALWRSLAPKRAGRATLARSLARSGDGRLSSKSPPGSVRGSLRGRADDDGAAAFLSVRVARAKGASRDEEGPASPTRCRRSGGGGGGGSWRGLLALLLGHAASCSATWCHAMPCA